MRSANSSEKRYEHRRAKRWTALLCSPASHLPAKSQGAAAPVPALVGSESPVVFEESGGLVQVRVAPPGSVGKRCTLYLRRPPSCRPRLGGGHGRMDPRWRVYKALPAAKQPHQERMNRACKVVKGVCHRVLTGKCCAPRHGWAFRR